MRQPEEIKKGLVVVRTYPVPEDEGVESSCTALITDQHEWVRLFPLPYRYLPQHQRFQKYQHIEVAVTKSSDSRLESYKPKDDSITILSDPLPTDNAWQARKDVVFPMMARSMCELQRKQKQNGYPTLGFFRPKTIHQLLIHETVPNWTPAQLDILRQEHVWMKKPAQELEKIPYWFRYEFSCDDPDCGESDPHCMMCADWEIGEAYRSWKRKYGDNWEAPFRQRFETEMIREKDTHFFVGTIKAHPQTWIIIGLFYPPTTQQGQLIFSP
jgi:hypothetical protein